MVKTSMSMCLGCGVFKLSEELSKREYCDKCEARLQSIDWLKHICKTKSEREKYELEKENGDCKSEDDETPPF